jgi:hypothetical protein
MLGRASLLEEIVFGDHGPEGMPKTKNRKRKKYKENNIGW